jgi:hypothetical protein
MKKFALGCALLLSSLVVSAIPAVACPGMDHHQETAPKTADKDKAEAPKPPDKTAEKAPPAKAAEPAKTTTPTKKAETKPATDKPAEKKADKVSSR